QAFAFAFAAFALLCSKHLQQAFAASICYKYLLCWKLLQ
ncbi:hypothetical protein Tco_0671384, partial [Tanacetum coccineum]